MNYYNYDKITNYILLEMENIRKKWKIDDKWEWEFQTYLI